MASRGVPLRVVLSRSPLRPWLSRPPFLNEQRSSPMKLRDVTRTYGGAVMHVWPPQLLVQIGPMIVEPGDGVLKNVKRFGNRLSLTVEHEGQEAWAGVEVEQDQRPAVDVVASVLRTSVGKAIKEIGDL